MTSLTGHVAVVTGGGRGIGRAIALGLAAHGAVVALLARTRPELEQTAADVAAAGSRALTCAADVTDDTAVDAALERIRAELGVPAILVNNAGWAPARTRLTRTAVTDIDRMLQTNLRAPVLLARRLLPEMERRGQGWIVNVASAFAETPHAGEATYAATKAALLAFSRALAAEYRSAGVRVAALCPGYVDTSFIPPNRRVDRRRFLRPEDVAAVALRFVLGELAADQVDIAVPAHEVVS